MQVRIRCGPCCFFLSLFRPVLCLLHRSPPLFPKEIPCSQPSCQGGQMWYHQFHSSKRQIIIYKSQGRSPVSPSWIICPRLKNKCMGYYDWAKLCPCSHSCGQWSWTLSRKQKKEYWVGKYLKDKNSGPLWLSMAWGTWHCCRSTAVCPSPWGSRVLHLASGTVHLETILLVWDVIQLFHTHTSHELHLCFWQL